jgi:hypothetical protein
MNDLRLQFDHIHQNDNNFCDYIKCLQYIGNRQKPKLTYPNIFLDLLDVTAVNFSRSEDLLFTDFIFYLLPKLEKFHFLE